MYTHGYPGSDTDPARFMLPTTLGFKEAGGWAKAYDSIQSAWMPSRMNIMRSPYADILFKKGEEVGATESIYRDQRP